MQQRFRRVALFFGATSLAAAGLIVVACGSDSSPTATPQLPEASSPNKDGSTGPGTDGGTNPDGGDLDSGEAPDCQMSPKLFTTTVAAGFFCSFYNADGGDSGTGNARNCPSDTTCCDPGANPAGSKTFPAAYCAPGKGQDACNNGAAAAGSTWVGLNDGGSVWECADKNSCGAGQVCCLTQDQVKLLLDPVKNKLNIGGYAKTNVDHPPACNDKTAYDTAGTKCETACAAGEKILCSPSDNSCGAGTVCTPFDALFRDLGYCAAP
jgi:hypothetical protein